MSATENHNKPIKDIIGKNYTFSFGRYKDRKLWEVMEGNAEAGVVADPLWLLQNDGIRFNLSARIREEIKTKVTALGMAIPGASV